MYNLHVDGWRINISLSGTLINRNVFSVCNVSGKKYSRHYISCRERETPQQSLLVLDDIVLFSMLSQNCKNLTSWLVWSPNIAHELKILSKFKLWCHCHHVLQLAAVRLTQVTLQTFFDWISFMSWEECVCKAIRCERVCVCVTVIVCEGKSF